jgi:hypothetical protein
VVAGVPLISGDDLELAATTVDENENGVTASAHNSVERVKEAKDIVESTSGKRVERSPGRQSVTRAHDSRSPIESE